jgi:hypothetical protein
VAHRCLDGQRTAHRVPDECRGLDVEVVEQLDGDIGQAGELKLAGQRLRRAEAGQVDGDDAVTLGEEREVAQPVLPVRAEGRAAEAPPVRRPARRSAVVRGRAALRRCGASCAGDVAPHGRPVASADLAAQDLAEGGLGEIVGELDRGHPLDRADCPSGCATTGRASSLTRCPMT